MSWAPAAADRAYHLFTADYEELRASVRQLLERRVTSRADQLEREARFPRDVFAELGGLGYLGLPLPEACGGADDLVADAVVCEELGRAGVFGFADGVLRHRAAALALAAGGGPGEALAQAAAGARVLALALAEPALDADPAQVRTRARRLDDRRWSLEGVKAFVPNAAAADGFVVSARTAERAGLFYVEASEVRREGREMLGLWESPVAEVVLEGARAVPLWDGEGAPLVERVLAWHDLGEAFALVGLARRAVETGLAYGSQRQAFGRPVARFQVWRHRWAEHSTTLEASRALCVQALRLLAHGEPAGRTIATARLHAGRTAYRTADECLQIHGGYGYMMEFPAQRYWRDVRQATITGGGDQARLEAISRRLGL